MAKPKRATILESGVGKNRHELFKKVIERYNEAIAKGFYLEAIALVESLIADRLESRIGEIESADVEHDTLGNLRSRLSSIETDKSIKKLIDKQVNTWSGERNIYIHRSAKIEQGVYKNLDDFLIEAKNTAETGFKIFRDLDRMIQKNRP